MWRSCVQILCAYMDVCYFIKSTTLAIYIRKLTYAVQGQLLSWHSIIFSLNCMHEWEIALHRCGEAVAKWGDWMIVLTRTGTPLPGVGSLIECIKQGYIHSTVFSKAQLECFVCRWHQINCYYAIYNINSETVGQPSDLDLIPLPPWRAREWFINL